MGFNAQMGHHVSIQLPSKIEFGMSKPDYVIVERQCGFPKVGLFLMPYREELNRHVLLTSLARAKREVHPATGEQSTRDSSSAAFPRFLRILQLVNLVENAYISFWFHLNHRSF